MITTACTTPAARVAHWDERLELMQSALATRSSAEWLEIFDRVQVPCAPINTRRDLLTDPQIAENQLIVESEHPAVGRIRQTRPAARFERTPAEIRRPAPTLGQHTDEVLSESGFSPDEIEKLRAEGVVA